MRHLYLLLFITSLSFSQQIEKNEIDDFTGNNVIETSWEPLTRANGIYSFTRIRKVNNVLILDLKFMLSGGAFRVDDGEVVYLKFEDGEVIKLNNPESQVSGMGEGSIGLVGSKAWGVFLPLKTDKETLLKIQRKPLNGVRLYTTDGYKDAEIKSKFNKKLDQLITLMAL